MGRKKLIQGIFRYFDAVLDGKTNTRLFSITAPSGMGKSSLILKIASMSHSRRRQKNILYMHWIQELQYHQGM